MIQPRFLSDCRAVFTTMLLALILGVTGCIRSMQPILEDSQVITNDSLVGTWVADDGKTHLQFLLCNGDDKTYLVHFGETAGDDDVYQVKLGKVSDVLLAQVTASPPKGTDMYQSHFLPLYSFMVIYQTRPNLVLSTMDNKWLAKYVDEHPKELQLLQPPEHEGDVVIVNSPTKQWQAFVLKHYKDEDAMGDKKTMFVHPGDPTTKNAEGK